MSTEIVVARSQQYTTNVELLLQQKMSKFRAASTEDFYTGKGAKAVEQIGATAARRRTTRHADTPLMNSPHDARWVHPLHYDWADLIDDPDRAEMLIDPTSPYAAAGAAAMERAVDDDWITAFFGTAKTGEDGSTSTTFPAAQQVAATVGAGAATGINIPKLRAAKKLLLAAEVDVDVEQLFCGINATQHDELLAETQATNLDYTDRPVLVDGRIKRFMGFDFIDSQRLTLNASSQRRIPVWARTGMHVGIWRDLVGRITEESTKNFSTQVYVSRSHGCTRTQEKKCVEIICAE